MSFVDYPTDEELAGRWKWFVGIGVVVAILGLIALLNIASATLVTTVLVGFLMVFGGIAQIIGAFAVNTGLGWRILMGILGVLYILVGIELIAEPLRGTILLTVVIAIVLIVDGIIRLFHAITGPPGHKLLNGTIGVIDILLGLWLWTEIPISGLAIGFFVGIQLLMAGILFVALGWMARPKSQASAPPSAV
jgi:uncharacterized membrane protein HdeD (DUF308 family)